MTRRKHNIDADQRTDPAGYLRAYRIANPEYAARDRAHQRARSRARVRLAAEQPRRFAELYAEECAREPLLTQQADQ